MSGWALRPRPAPGRHPALWVPERPGRMSPRSINEAFVAAETPPVWTRTWICTAYEYRNQLLEASLKRRLGDDWDLA